MSTSYSRFVLNVVKGHHIQLRYHLSLLHNFKHFIIMAAIIHYPIIHEEVDKLLAEGAIQTSTGSAGF